MQYIEDIISYSRKNKSTLLFNVENRNWLPSFPYENKHKLNAMALLSIETPRDLSQFLGVPMHQIEEMICNPSYQHHAIKKKRGGIRHIDAPEQELKRLQKRLNYFLQAYYLWIKPAEIHGFVINPHFGETRYNIVENARPHTGKAHLLNIDLKDFFPSIKAGRVKRLFLSPYFGYGEEVATALTLLTTYAGKLPTGAPTSPVLSNFICLHLDAHLRRFCYENQLTFTRYADDLTFSSDTPITQEAIDSIKRIIGENGFEINEKKLHLQSANRRQVVTGLTVNEKVNVDRKLLKRTRAMLHDLVTNGIEVATQRHFNLQEAPPEEFCKYFFNCLKGYMHFISQVRGGDDPVYLRLKQQFDAGPRFRCCPNDEAS
ncbi:reverse transcriptase family protein [Parabacteroides sp. OttesenSCG-928-B22]|nr:reverse transcriptase family protein [Parabacteroides sp. OttesenSCG-928-B22]